MAQGSGRLRLRSGVPVRGDLAPWISAAMLAWISAIPISNSTVNGARRRASLGQTGSPKQLAANAHRSGNVRLPAR